MPSAIEQIRQQAAQLPAAPALQQWRESALQSLNEALWPGKKTENWKYTSLATIAGENFVPANHAVQTVQASDEAHTITLRDGEIFIGSALAQTPGLSITALNEACEAQLQQLGSISARSSNQPFAVINQACLQNGLIIEVADNVQIREPLKLCIEQKQLKGMHTVRLFFRIGKNSSLSVSETLLDGNTEGVQNSICEIALADNSELHWLRNSAAHGNTTGIHGMHIAQSAHSRMRLYPLLNAGKLSRQDVRCHLLEAGADLQMYGVFLANAKNHVDLQVCVEHHAPHCTSHQDFKGLATEQGNGIFNGRIHIHPYAVKTQADLSNKNLLFSNQAAINSKPELEIYNDDVKCSHGTTVGQLDEIAVFYLQSRGIDEVSARRLLALGFINEVLQTLPENLQESGIANTLLEELHFTGSGE